MKKAFDALKRKWEEEPIQVIIVASFAAVAAAKLIDAVSASQSRSAYAKQIDYKVKHNY